MWKDVPVGSVMVAFDEGGVVLCPERVDVGRTLS